MSTHNRRTFIGGALATGATYALARSAHAASDRTAIYDQIKRRHDQTVAPLQEWIRQPSIAAENRGVNEGCELTMRMLRDAGFQRVERSRPMASPAFLRRSMPARGARSASTSCTTSSRRIRRNGHRRRGRRACVDLPDLGKVVMGRGAVNQKGPQSAFLAALHAIRDAGRKLPVNLVLVAEGEEEIGSPHFPQVVLAQRRCTRRSRSAKASSCPRRRSRSRRQRHGIARCQGHRGARAGRERREVGSRPSEGRALEQPRASRQSGVASGAGAQHADRSQWRSGDRRTTREGQAPLGGRVKNARRGRHAHR